MWISCIILLSWLLSQNLDILPKQRDTALKRYCSHHIRLEGICSSFQQHLHHLTMSLCQSHHQRPLPTLDHGEVIAILPILCARSSRTGLAHQAVRLEHNNGSSYTLKRKYVFYAGFVASFTGSCGNNARVEIGRRH